MGSDVETAADLPVRVAEDALMSRLSGGEAQALQEIMSVHGPGVLNFLCHLTGSREAAEDLTQETFLRVFRKAASFRGNGHGVRPWLYSIARNLAVNLRRRRRVAASVPPSPSFPVCRPSERYLREELQERIKRGLAEIQEPYRSPLVLCAVEGFSYEEAAVACGCSVKTLSSRLARARRKFRDFIAPYLENRSHE